MLRSSPGGSPHTHNSISRSVLVPAFGNTSALLRKSYIGPVAFTIAAAVALLLAESLEWYSWIVGAYMAVMFNYFVYHLCGRAKPWWGISLVCGVMMLSLAGGAVVFINSPIFAVFEVLGASQLQQPHSSLVMQLWAGLCVGLREELWKALPVLFLAFAAVKWRGPWVQSLGVFEPLDGILMGVAAGTGFTLIETITIYVARVAQSPHGGEASAVELLFPRLLSELGGHLAYSGYFGYFIGLAVLRPRLAPGLLVLGWLSSAALHGAWDGLGSAFQGPLAALVLTVVGTASYACLAAAILKARQLSPNRAKNFATVVASSAPRPVSRPASYAKLAAPPRSSLALLLGGVRHALTPGVRIESTALGSSQHAAAGAVAEVTTNPKDPSILGLRNITQQVWRAVVPSGKLVQVEPGRAIRLETGTTIDFGGVIGRIQ
jgi:RsiW-degrading membrane proteinase PrsW (M82 family)